MAPAPRAAKGVLMPGGVPGPAVVTGSRGPKMPNAPPTGVIPAVQILSSHSLVLSFFFFIFVILYIRFPPAAAAAAAAVKVEFTIVWLFTNYYCVCG
jgi:hypothetical protein